MMENLSEHEHEFSDLERDIQDIKNSKEFNDWLKKVLSLTYSVWGKSSSQYIYAKHMEKHYKIISLLNHFDLHVAQDDAYEIIEICEEALK